jgi:hypothetical protein
MRASEMSGNTSRTFAHKAMSRMNSTTKRSKASRKSDLEGFNLNDRDGRLTRNMFTFRVREFVDSPEGCLTAGAWWNTEHLAARTAHNRLRVDASMQIVSSMRRSRKI